MKKVITAETIRVEHAAGRDRIEVTLPQCIVTPEARTVADRLGVRLLETVIPSGRSVPGAKPAPPRTQPPPVAGPTTQEIAAIRAAVVARLPDKDIPAALVDQLIEKTLRERNLAPPKRAQDSAGASKPAAAQGRPGGIKHVDGRSVRLGKFEGAGEGSEVGIADVITAVDGSPMAAGYMAWSRCFFPWKLTYDEIDLVIEGELHIRCEGQTVVGRPGDVIYIPKGTSLEFGTPASTRFVYVTYPADWQAA